MNKTYHTLSERFADDSCSELSFDYVKSTIASTIKVSEKCNTNTILLKYINIIFIIVLC